MLKHFFTNSIFNKYCSYHFKKLYIKYFIALIAFTLFPIFTLSSIFYTNLVQTYYNKFSEKYTAELENLSYKSEYWISIMEGELIQLSDNPAILNYQKMYYPGQYVDELLAVDSAFNNLKLKYRIIDSIYLYDPVSQYFINSLGGTYTYEHFYDTEWLNQYDAKFHIQRYPLRLNMNSDIYETQAYKKKFFITPKKVITLAKSSSDGKIIAINVDGKRLYDEINTSTDNHFSFLILDTNKQLVLSNYKEKSITHFDPTQLNYHPKYNFYSDKNYIYLTHDIAYDQWTCALVVPKTVLTNEFFYFKKYILFISCALLIICIIFAFWISRLLYSPVNNLVLNIKNFANNEDTYNEKKLQDEIHFFRSTFNQLAKDKALLKDTLVMYEKTVRNRYFMDFIDQKISYTEFHMSLESLNIHYENSYCKLLLLSAPKSLLGNKLDKVNKISRLNIIESIDSYINHTSNGIFYDINRSMYFAFFTGDTEDHLEKFQSNIRHFALEVFEVGYFSSSSQVLANIKQLPTAFHETLEALNYAIFFQKSKTLITYNDVSDRKEQSFIYPINEETSILKDTILKDKKSVKLHIQQIIGYITQESSANQYTAITVANRILSTLSKEFPLEEIIDFNPYEKLRDAHNITILFENLFVITEHIIDYISSNSKEENHYCNQVKDYLLEHYKEDISVSNLSDYINISYPYLSKLFKEHEGMNIIEYLNSIRIDKAMELLKDSDENLTYIAETVGYNNTQSLQRFFKKFKGITPGEYRRLEQLKLNTHLENP